MPKYSGNPGETFTLFHLSNEMKGPAAYSVHREAVRKRIRELWPESESIIPQDSPLQKDVREFDVSPEEQTALGEGLWSIFSDEKTPDSLREVCRNQAKKLKVSGAFEKRLGEQKIAKLMESDDAIKGDEDAGKPV